MSNANGMSISNKVYRVKLKSPAVLTSSIKNKGQENL